MGPQPLQPLDPRVWALSFPPLPNLVVRTPQVPSFWGPRSPSFQSYSLLGIPRGLGSQLPPPSRPRNPDPRPGIIQASRLGRTGSWIRNAVISRPLPAQLPAVPPPGPHLPSQSVFRLAGTAGTGSLGPLAGGACSPDARVGSLARIPGRRLSYPSGLATFSERAYIRPRASPRAPPTGTRPLSWCPEKLHHGVLHLHSPTPSYLPDPSGRESESLLAYPRPQTAGQPRARGAARGEPSSLISVSPPHLEFPFSANAVPLLLLS